MNSLPVTIALLLGSAAAIYLACEVFVNGVEWVGRRLAVGEQATGSILAAIGTALPESVVTFVAVAFGASAAQKQIGVGAALGGPLVLSTIAYATVGIVLICCRTKLPKTAAIRNDFHSLSRDQGWFLVIFAAKIGLGLAAFAFKPWLGVLFLAAYGAYFWKEMRGTSDIEEEALEPLKLMPRVADPPTWAAVVQTVAALGVIFAASHLFVKQLDVLGPALGLKPQLLALLLSPIATELPETLNAVIWVRQGRHRLALANISGAMMIQATVPTAFGLFFTPWVLDPALLVGAAVTAVAVLAMFLAFRRGFISRVFLAAMAGFYGLFAVLVLALKLY
ncbi:sodium:calcium antiporter [Phenylobacterium sp.]|uniref:sodium:calcium antiporter n=1 Tax=Phenylobacterium sp. TaxID=1871053 RepID=UPI002F3E401E